MADVYVNALTTISTEPTTTDSIVAVNRNTNEGKIIDYNKLADVILNKLTSKQYSGLNTTSKLLVGAINELDSDVSSLNSDVSAINSRFPLYHKYLSFGALTSISITLGNNPGSGSPIFFFGRSGSSSALSANYGVITFDGNGAYISQANDAYPVTVSLSGTTLTLTCTTNWSALRLISSLEMS